MHEQNAKQNNKKPETRFGFYVFININKTGLKSDKIHRSIIKEICSSSPKIYYQRVLEYSKFF